MYFKTVCWKYAPRQDGTCSVKVYVNLHRQQKYYPVEGIYVTPQDFDDKRGIVRPKHPLSKVYNSKIRAFRNKVEEHFIKGGGFDEIGTNDSGSLLKFVDKYITESQVLSKGTKRNYRSLEFRLTQFAQAQGRKDLFFYDVDDNFEREYTAFMQGNGATLPTIGQHFARLKKIMRTAAKEGLHNTESYRNFPTYQNRIPEKVYLNQEEIEKIANLDLTSHQHLEVERDRFLVSYYLMLRFSDVNRLKKNWVFTHQGQSYIRVIQKKTKEEAVLPIKSAVINLLDKHDWSFSSTNHEANKKIKVVAAMAGINELVGTPPQVKSQLITSHTARRSAATNLYLEGANLKTIADLGGWATAETLRVYLKASKFDSAQMAKDLKFFK